MPLKDFIRRDARLSEHRAFLLNKSRLKERLHRTRCFLRRPRFSSVADGCYSRSIITLLRIYSNSQSRRDVRTNEHVHVPPNTRAHRAIVIIPLIQCKFPRRRKQENFNLKVFPMVHYSAAWHKSHGITSNINIGFSMATYIPGIHRKLLRGQ